LHILVADYVPIANKGEEAIVRGIGDMLSGGRRVELGLFDNVAEVTQRNGLTIFPRDWIFRFEGNASLAGLRRVAMQIRIATGLTLGAYGRLRNLVSGRAAHCRPLREFFERAELVLVGHDGVFCVESCGILRLARRYGKRAGILGASTGIGGGRLYKAGLYRRAMDEADFCVFRERHSCQSMQRVARNPGKLIVGPDPAFALHPAPAEAAREVLERIERCRKARTENRPVIAVTVLETGRVYAGFRPDLAGPAKQDVHARYLATALAALVERHRAFVLFLPHSIERQGNDIVAARHVVAQMRNPEADAAILDADLGARQLKAVVAECDFLVGERTHSLIAAVSTGTPFAALTNRRDTRTHGMIGAMCHCQDRIIDMDVASASQAASTIQQLFETRDAARQALERTRAELADQTRQVARLVWGCPQDPSG
jgi:polysaccharide pyruvyl transferase WcaK-like protein